MTKFAPKMALMAAASLLSLAACSSINMPNPFAGSKTKIEANKAAVVEDKKLITMLDGWFEEDILDSPEFATYLGRKEGYDSWNERTEEELDKHRRRTEQRLATLRSTINHDALSPGGQLSYRLFDYSSEQSLRNDNFRDSRFVLSQFRGIHSQIPVTLANYHKINSVKDAEDYISRVSKIDEVLGQAATLMEARAAKGFTLPEFSYPLIVESAQNVRKGKPFTKNGLSPIYKDFTTKLDKLDTDKATKDRLLTELVAALKDDADRGYREFEKRSAAIGSGVHGNYGVAKFSNGEAYYNELLRNYTTTSMTAEEVHALGLAEVARIHGEMKAIMRQVGYDGTLAEFFDFMRTDKQFYKPNTDKGRAEYLELARSYIGNIEPRLDDLFITKPKAPVVVRRVEPFRERASGKAFYNQPAPDGSRPGTFYANLKDMADMPTYQLEALVYHEAIPGHHMQRAIQIETTGLPKYRQFGGYTAYTEGWGLYSEYLGKDLGFYEDPYSDFGRLAMELWRAARLVVDTGLHAEGWEMQKAIDYLTTNTPNPEGDCRNAIERYIVYPGQATAYKIGMNKILDLRRNAEASLGDKFSIREFHETVLISGPVPLEVLEGRIADWVASKR